MIDFGEIDVILLSNYQCMMGLPYITEYTNFKGAVYATEPTLQIARWFMDSNWCYVVVIIIAWTLGDSLLGNTWMYFFVYEVYDRSALCL